ncbi:hypothetical protein ACVWW6_006050 [Bradyrhizobium sp. USDA 3311]
MRNCACGADRPGRRWYFGGGDVIDIATARELDELAARIARIRPISNSNPHAFYEERSEVASQVRALATRLRCGDQVVPSDAADVPAPIGRQVERKRVVHVGGRTTLVLERLARAKFVLERAGVR